MASGLDEAIDNWQRATRRLVSVARAFDAARWREPSANPGWSNKDMLAHLATGYYQRLALLRGIVAHGAPDPLPDADAANADRIDTHKNTPADELIATLEATRAEVLALLRQVPVDTLDQTVTIGDRRERLGDYLRDLSRHDLDHLADLRPAPAGITR